MPALRGLTSFKPIFHKGFLLEAKAESSLFSAKYSGFVPKESRDITIWSVSLIARA
jgi:hypothetical protein